MNRKFKSSLLYVSALLVLCITMVTLPVDACTSVIVGKNISETGEVLLGHNEDNGGRLVMLQYKVPRMKHQAGEIITLENGKAQIPQVAETWAYTWSETRIPSPGESFSDFFINEWGVAVASDSCLASKEDQPQLKDGGIGYGIRRLVAERAKTAREGVKIATELLNTYGYSASGRSYQIVDKNEGWMLQIVNGKHYVAEKIADDEVAVISNHYTIRAVDLNDTNNFIASPDIISYAIDRGWYHQAVENDYSDFDFAKAYQRADKYNIPFNVLRHKHGLEIILGEKTNFVELPFAVKPDKKITINDVKNMLRSHYEGTSDDLTNEYQTSPHFTNNRVICTALTQESIVVQFRENPDFTVIWHALGHPCTSAYVPWYLGMLEVPTGFNWINPQVGMDTHFKAATEDFNYNSNHAWWVFQDIQNIADPQYGKLINEIQTSIHQLETKWEKNQSMLESKAQSLYQQRRTNGLQYLTNYSNQQSQEAQRMAVEIFNRFSIAKITVLDKELKMSCDSCDSEYATISVAILSNKNFDVANIDPTTILFGFAYQKPANWAKVQNSRLEDINHDGMPDLVVNFNRKDISKNAIPCYSDIWLFAKTQNGDPIVARDFVNVIK
jgi:dipeptidase